MMWVVASFNEKEQIGDGFLKALADANRAQFRYDVRLSPGQKDEKAPSTRWTAESIGQKLAEIEREAGRAPANVWVCGSPSMNQAFEEAFASLQAQGKISNVTRAVVL